jgi:hypothetical protein
MDSFTFAALMLVIAAHLISAHRSRAMDNVTFTSLVLVIVALYLV